MSRRKKSKKLMECYLCACIITRDTNRDNPVKATKEDVIPKCKLKKGQKPLIRYACYDCNQDKACYDLYDHIQKSGIDEQEFLERNRLDGEIISLYRRQERSK